MRKINKNRCEMFEKREDINSFISIMSLRLEIIKIVLTAVKRK